MRCILAVAALLAVTLTAQQKKPVTLESLSGMRMPAGMMGGAPVWAPDGKRYVSRTTKDGALKLVVYDVATKSEKDLLAMSEITKAVKPVPAEKAMGWENRRVSERPIQWSEDGGSLLLIERGDLFLVDAATGKWQPLTESNVAERDAKLSPDGKKVSFRRDHDLYVLDIASKKETRLTTDGSASIWNGMLDWVYPEELDLGTAHWWSPDSKQIAYLQFDVSREHLYPHTDALPIQPVSEPQRYPKAGTPNADVRVGVVPVSGGLTKWMDYGESRDHLLARVYWTPDSRQLAAFRLNRVQDKLDILAADVESGSSKPLVQERDPAWININDDFRFLKDGSFVWSSERDGWRHIYHHDKDGKTLRQLTKGEWEVANVACVDESAKKVYFVSTEKSPLERQLYVIGFDGKNKKQLTQGDGSHTVSMSPSCEYFQDSYSNLSTPSKRSLHSAPDGGLVTVLAEPDRKDADEYQWQPTEIHTVKGPDGTVFYGRLIKPANFDPAKKYPVIVSVYGGPHAQSVRNSWPGVVNWDQALAQKGFVIWQMDNRGSSGRGHAWEAKLYRRTGKVELEDQKTGIDYLVKLGFVDEKRIGITGWSYGGYMTLYSMLHAPDVFAAGVAGAAVTDWRNYDTIYTERYMGLPQQNEQGYKDSSPVSAAANLKGKLLIVHNIEDDNVLFANAVQMANALQLAKKPFEMQYYQFKSHGLMGPLRSHYMETATRFFIDALKP